MGEAIMTRRDKVYQTITFDIYPGIVGSSVAPLLEGRRALAATTVGNYALFAGGDRYDKDVGYGGSAFVDRYDTSLTRYGWSMLSKYRSDLAATTVGNYALFGGGVQWTYDGSSDSFIGTVTSTVDAYDNSSTRSTPTELHYPRYRLAATTVGDYALFAGGRILTTGYRDSTNILDAYDTSLTRSSPISMSVSRAYGVATTVGNYALFGGGAERGYDNFVSTVDAYDTSLVRSTPTDLNRGTDLSAATTVGNYAIFAGGYTNEYHNYGTNIVTVYNTNLVRSTPTELSVGRGDLAATTVGDYALFGGGKHLSNISQVVDVYDISLTRSTATDLSEARFDLTATSVGNYALFGGGYGGSGLYSSTTVDAYTLDTSPVSLTVYPGTKYKVWDMQNELTATTMQTLTGSLPLTGYIKVKKVNVD